MRTVIFGVDGLTFRIVRPLIERGDLPNFARLQREGVTADFISTACPFTAPAWMSIATGLRPAKHGVFDFWEFDTTSTQPTAKLVTHRKGGKAIWNILSEFGKRVVVLNVPLTYPPEPVNGMMVSGLMTPTSSSAYTSPLSFKDELYNVVPDYRIDLSGDQMSERQLYDQVMQMTEKRIQLQEHLLSEHEWDFAFLCYVGPDRLQHRLWGSIITLDHEATRYYRLLDDALGRVLGHLTAEDMLFVVSDHGFVGLSTKFYINEYLCRQNLLQVPASRKRERSRLLGMGRDIAQRLHLLDATKKIRHRYNEFYNRSTSPEKNIDFNNVVWSESQAYVLSWSAFGGGYADIVMSPHATADDIERLRTALSNERDPETGDPLVRTIYTTDDLGEGPFRPQQEHLIIIPSPGTTFHLLTGRKNLWEKEKISQGCHEPEGIFYAYGAGIRRGVQVNALQVYDLVPTILHALNIAVKEPLDGQVAHEIFTEDTTRYVEVGESMVARKLKQLRMSKD
ncbi:MAG: alkaline phosphatase family protein [Ktedonobacteraceae bacterium]